MSSRARDRGRGRVAQSVRRARRETRARSRRRSRPRRRSVDDGARAAAASPARHASNGKGYGSTGGAVRASCSSQIAAWPSNVIGRVKPSSAAAASNSRPAEVVAKTRVPVCEQAERARRSASGNSNGGRGQVGQAVELREEAGGGLHRVPRRRVAAGERGRPQVRDALEAVLDAAHEELAAPDRAVVAVAVPSRLTPSTRVSPGAALGQHRGDVRAMMLDGAHAPARGELERMRGRRVLRDARRARPAGPRHATSYIASRSSMVSRKARRRPRSASRSPMCWLTNAWPSTTSVIGVLEVGADRQDRPVDRQSRDRAGRVAAGRAGGSTGPSGPARTTESSTRRAIGRSPTRNASARSGQPLRARRRPRTRSARSSGWRWS